MPERVLGEIIELLKDPAEPWAGHIVWHHCDNSRSCSGTPGMPDLFIAGTGNAVWVEVKPNRGERLRPEQTTWRYMLSANGQHHLVWTAEDLADGSVRAILLELLLV